jgi:ParB family chromosome partitioning protein
MVGSPGRWQELRYDRALAQSWLMGGHAIATSKALFDLSLYTGEILTDLFGEDGYFADAGPF